MQLMKLTTATGLGTMGAVALATAIWPALAGVVSGLLVTVLCAGAATLAVLGGRRVRGELAWRRELRAMPVCDTAWAYRPPAAAAPTLHELRESA